MKRERFRINDNTRHWWTLNFEPLYLWHKSTGVCMGQFIRENRSEIDRQIMREMHHVGRTNQATL